MVIILCSMNLCVITQYLVLDPAFVGLSLVYAASISGLLQYSVRLSAKVEDLVRYFVGVNWICYSFM